MSILRPQILWFLFLALLPVILYLLFRRRRNEVPWASTYILRLALASGKRQSLWKQIIIIFIRTVMIALAVLAFSRPFKAYQLDDSNQEFPHGNGILQRIIILDNSLSMNARHGVGTRFDSAREAVSGLFSSMRHGDTFQIIPLCPKDSGGKLKLQSYSCPVSANEARKTVSLFKISSASPDFNGALRKAIDAFKNSAALGRQLIIITDLARIDHPSLEDYDVFGELLANLNVRLATLNLGSRESLNIAVTGIETGTETLLTGQPTNTYVEVANFSDRGGSDAQLQFYTDGKLSAQKPCVLSAGQRRSFSFPVTLDKGQHRLEVRLNEDAYEADNQREFFVQAKKDVGMLLIIPKEEKGEGFEQEDAFLQRAMKVTEKAPFSFSLETVKESMVTERNLEGKQVVIIGSAMNLPKAFLQALARFVQRGGGLILTTGPQTDAAEFNRIFAQFLPERLLEPFRMEVDPERYLNIQTSEIGLPILREFEQVDNGDLSRARIYNYYRLSDMVDDGKKRRGKILLRMTNGDPLLVMSSFGKGRIFLWTTTLGGGWNSLPVRQTYIPLLYRLFNYAGSFNLTPRNIKQNDPLIYETTENVSSLYVTTPDSKLLECPTVKAGNRTFVRFEKTSVPGTYDLQNSQGNTVASFSVAMPLHESDLRILTEPEQKRFCKFLQTAFAGNSEELKKALWRKGDGNEQAGWFFIAVIALLLLDACLTRIWFS